MVGLGSPCPSTHFGSRRIFMGKNWVPHDLNAVELATFRWHANNLENEAIRLYVTKRDKFLKICKVFETASKSLQALRGSCNSNDDCPDGWHCSSNECQPDA
jgi:hypothetical protein